MRLADLTFEHWLEHVFSHEVRFQRPAWFFDADHDWWDPKPVVAVGYLTRLFEDAETALRYFSDSQIAQGLTYLVSTSASGDNGWLYSRDVQLEERVRCIEAVASLFVQIFVPRCTPHLSHLSESEAGTLNCVCYMWWDEFPCVALVDDPALQILHATVFRTIEKILRLDSLACQESALHGLGHWQRGHERRTAQIIDSFLRDRLDLDPRLIGYAKSARCGCVL